jgi:hypothetical protein
VAVVETSGYTPPLHSATTLRVAPTTVNTPRNVVLLFRTEAFGFYVKEILFLQKFSVKIEEEELF